MSSAPVPAEPLGEGAAGVRQAMLERVALGAMFVALAASPSYVVRFHVAGLPSDMLEVLLLVAIVLGLAALGGRLQIWNPLTPPALLFLAGATLDVWFSPSHKEAAGAWKAYFIEPALASLVIVGLATTRRRVMVILAGLGVAGTVVAVLNAANSLEALAAHRFSVVTPPVAVYNSANAVPLYLAPLVAVALPLVLFSDEPRERLGAAVFSGLAALAILLSFSRAGWVTLGAVAVFAGLFHRWRWRMLGVLVAGGLVLGLGVPKARHRILVEFDFNSPDNTVRLRESLWRSSIRMLEHHPLFGGGLSGFERSVAPYRVPTYHEHLIYPHDIFLNFWSETGLVGLAGFLWLCGGLIRQCLLGLRREPWVRALSIGLLGVLLAFLVHGLVDVPYFKNDQALAFWALIGVQLGAMAGVPALARGRGAAGEA
ncbi:MAG: O-antigen ligase family protein [Candidatus Dormibacterales bacterium]